MVWNGDNYDEINSSWNECFTIFEVGCISKYVFSAAKFSVPTQCEIERSKSLFQSFVKVCMQQVVDCLIPNCVRTQPCLRLTTCRRELKRFDTWAGVRIFFNQAERTCTCGEQTAQPSFCFVWIGKGILRHGFWLMSSASDARTSMMLLQTEMHSTWVVLQCRRGVALHPQDWASMQLQQWGRTKEWVSQMRSRYVELLISWGWGWGGWEWPL